MPLGFAEVGLISTKLLRSDMNIPENVQNNHYLFHGEVIVFSMHPLESLRVVCVRVFVVFNY